MDTKYYIRFYIKTPRGHESFARYDIGNRKDLAYDLFRKLAGNDEDPANCILQMDLMETHNNLPLNLKLTGCTLEEMAENCKLITKEAFKIFTLES